MYFIWFHFYFIDKKWEGEEVEIYIRENKLSIKYRRISAIFGPILLIPKQISISPSQVSIG